LGGLKLAALFYAATLILHRDTTRVPAKNSCKPRPESESAARTRPDQTARACALLSVQCFAAKNLPELLRRVPSFVLFLCESMTRRLFQVRLAEGGCELVGSLVNFDLIMIYQTIARSMRTGVLVLTDGRGETVSEFCFENGTPRWGRFQHLQGEEAFWQLFMQPRKAWTFSFSRQSQIVRYRF
jgi:hypothetical protein